MTINRKFIRNTMRHAAEKKGVKASKWVRNEWDRYQRKKVGGKKRAINKAKGTLPRRKWRMWIKLALAEK